MRVAIRLHTKGRTSDYKELIKSTNNQNPMQARNLRSNDPEQVYYETLFADLDWFYERKEGAWKAFQSELRTLGIIARQESLKLQICEKWGQVRSIDNLETSQAWLSFIGFSNEAIHNKRDIFSDEKFYELIFKKRPAKHGYDYNFSFQDPAVRTEAEDQAPSPHALLLAELLREIADELTPTRKQNRDELIEAIKVGEVEQGRPRRSPCSGRILPFQGWF